MWRETLANEQWRNDVSKMAHTEDCSIRGFMNNEVKSKTLICEMCKEYEIQLQVTRDELSSIIMVNKRNYFYTRQLRLLRGLTKA